MAIPDSSLHAAVMEKLHGWVDYATLAAAMEQFPDVDIFLAGGVLRNLASGSAKQSRDFDFFIRGADVDAFLEQLAQVGALSYGPFGSPRWQGTGSKTCYCDIVRIDGFYNGLWPCEDIVDVLNQFDFTANAIAVNLRNGELHDPQNGMRDASRRVMRAVRFDYPEEAISTTTTLSRNCILWMRLKHYGATLGFETDTVTSRWLQQHAHYSREAGAFEALFFKPVVND